MKKNRLMMSLGPNVYALVEVCRPVIGVNITILRLLMGCRI
jgi:hypothetical protein